MSNIEEIIFYLLLIDSIGANLVAWFGHTWYTSHFRLMSRYFPVAKGWCVAYFVLVLWIGTMLLRLGMFS